MVKRSRSVDLYSLNNQMKLFPFMTAASFIGTPMFIVPPVEANQNYSIGASMFIGPDGKEVNQCPHRHRKPRSIYRSTRHEVRPIIRRSLRHKVRPIVRRSFRHEVRPIIRRSFQHEVRPIIRRSFRYNFLTIRNISRSGDQ